MGDVGGGGGCDLLPEPAPRHPQAHRLFENSIRAGSFHPFDGLIYSQNGKVQCQDGEALTAEEIISMDWLAENVVGVIPEFKDLTQEAQTLVRLQGVKEDERKDAEE